MGSPDWSLYPSEYRKAYGLASGAGRTLFLEWFSKNPLPAPKRKRVKIMLPTLMLRTLEAPAAKEVLPEPLKQPTITEPPKRKRIKIRRDA